MCGGGGGGGGRAGGVIGFVEKGGGWVEGLLWGRGCVFQFVVLVLGWGGGLEK